MKSLSDLEFFKWLYFVLPTYVAEYAWNGAYAIRFCLFVCLSLKKIQVWRCKKAFPALTSKVTRGAI